MSRGKDPVDDALSAIICGDAEMDAARDFLAVMARRGLDQFHRDRSALFDFPPEFFVAKDALADFEKAMRLEYPR